MNELLKNCQNWYEQRDQRERLLVLGLGCALIYVLFLLILIHPLEYQKSTLVADIKDATNQKNIWKVKIDALNKIALSPLYKQWQIEHQKYQLAAEQAKALMQISPTSQAQLIINALLEPQTNVTLAQIKNLPDSPYNPDNAKTTTHIYQQRIMVTILSNFNDSVNYLLRLEQEFPNLHWNSLNYQVLQYPVAKVEMEVSVLYDKN